MSHIQRFLKGDEMTRVLWSMIPETLAFAPLGIGIVPYALPSSVDLAEATLEQIKTHDEARYRSRRSGHHGCLRPD